MRLLILIEFIITLLCACNESQTKKLSDVTVSKEQVSTPQKSEEIYTGTIGELKVNSSCTAI